MLCQKCWMEEAKVHFRYLSMRLVHEVHYCLACAQEENLSWLLAWGHGCEASESDAQAQPITLRREPVRGSGQGGALTLVGVGVGLCECGCRLVVGAEMPCGHGTYAFTGKVMRVEHTCHCGRDHEVCVPQVVCLACGATQRVPVLATAQTCLWDEQRRRLVSVEHDLQHGKATWGTFSIRN